MAFTLEAKRMMWSALALGGFLAAWPTPARAVPCPPAAQEALRAGWSALHEGRFSEARGDFERAKAGCDALVDAQSGLGFVALRLGETARAESCFRAVIAVDSLNGDGWAGLTHVAMREGRSAAALAAGLRAVALQPGNREVRDVLDQVLPGWERPRPPRPAERGAPLRLQARVHGDRFEIHTGSGWKPFFVKGLNLGVALPGRFAAEFPVDSARYAGWIDTIAAMNANVLRLYTLFPPSFYRALAAWNVAHRDRALWLVHGVWTELPPDHRFDDESWAAEFREEMRRVVDVIHGAADVPTRPGHAGGRYDADVSPWTLAFILGREWEPFAVKGFNARHPGVHAYRGRLLEVSGGTATDVWMAQQCDFMQADELDRHGALRPIAYTNWPTLDPLRHPTEAGTQEERVLRQKAGVPSSGSRLEYENDGEALDANLVQPTAANPAGWFASYHAYPYYPDFMIHDPDYARAHSSLGASNYFGYLSALRRHHVGLPVLISEYGVPSSRGLAHFQPQGWNHGGLDERSVAEVDARMTREIYESGMAGGILFAWIDEWFKRNWTVIDLELPGERTRFWHNVLDPEQNYGVLAMDSGSEDGPCLGGDALAWRALHPLAQAKDERGVLRSIRLGCDPSYVYLALELSPEASTPLAWDSLGLRVAIDTHRVDLGQRTLPDRMATGDVGFEFLLDFSDPGTASIRVAPGYNPYRGTAAWTQRGDDRGHFYQPLRETARHDGRFDSLFILTNRARFGRDGTFFPARGDDRGRLRFGTEDRSSLSDWYLDPAAGLLEVRIPWGLLNVTDPSSHTVLADRSAPGTFATHSTEGFRVGAVAYSKHTLRTIEALPALDARGRWDRRSFVPWSWDPWEMPAYHARLKPAYEAMRSVWAELPVRSLSDRTEP